MSELVTGHAGMPHIDAGDMRAKNKGLLGTGNYYLASVSDNVNVSPASQITVPQMELILDGSFCRLDGTDSVSIPATSQGRYRRDYIVARITNTDGVEGLEVDVVLGEPALTDKAAAYPELSITYNNKEYALYRTLVYQSDVLSVICQLSEIKSISSMQGRIIPISEGGTGVNNKTDLLKALGLSANHGKIVVQNGPDNDINMTTANTYYELASLVLEPGTYSVKASASFRKGVAGKDTIQIYDKTGNTSRGIASIEHSISEDISQFVTHDFQVTKTSTICVRTSCTAANRKVGSAYVRATCLK